MKLFTNALLPTSSNAMKRVNVLFDEKIIKVSADEIITEESPELIDLEGAILLPGAIDAHSHLLGSHHSSKSLQSMSADALKGGWTTLAELSYHYPRPIYSLADLKGRKELIEGHSHVDMAFWGFVDITDYPYHAEAAQLIWKKGVVGIALMSPSPNSALREMSFTEIQELFMDIYESDTAFAFQGWDTDATAEFSFEAQNSAIKKLLRRMQENPIHIPRVASYPTIEFVNTISKRSDISFSISCSDIMALYDETANPGGYSTEFEGQTPDEKEYKDLIFELVRTNKIYMLSNNAGQQEPAVAGIFQAAPPELMRISYVWVLSELWKKRKVPLATCLKMLSENPAKRLGIYPLKGSLDPGSEADFVIYDPAGETPYTNGNGVSQPLEGRIKSVYLRGTEVFNGKKTASPAGIFLARQTNPKRRHNKSTWI